MRIILDLSDDLLKQASTRAAVQRTTLTAVLESALRHYLAGAQHPSRMRAGAPLTLTVEPGERTPRTR